MANVNNGHRQRVRERMLKEGLDGFQDHEILELLLYQSIPRKDTNKIAHKLLLAFGNLSNVINASPKNLMAVDGISQVTACNIAMLKEVWQRCRRQEAEKPELNTLATIVQYARKLIAESYVERLVVVYVDRTTHFIYRDEYLADDKYNVRLEIKKVISTAIRLDASGILLFHCHIGNDCEPSLNDDDCTQKLIYALSGLEIVLLEHIIFNAEGQYYSYFRDGKIDKYIEEYNQKIKR